MCLQLNSIGKYLEFTMNEKQSFKEQTIAKHTHNFNKRNELIACAYSKIKMSAQI